MSRAAIPILILQTAIAGITPRPLPIHWAPQALASGPCIS